MHTKTLVSTDLISFNPLSTRSGVYSPSLGKSQQKLGECYGFNFKNFEIFLNKIVPFSIPKMAKNSNFDLCPVHLPGQNVFCPGQNQICPRQINFVHDKIFFVQDKNFVHGSKQVSLKQK